MLDYEANAEVIEKVKEINDKLNEEKDGKMRTKLMFEQLLRGLYIDNDLYTVSEGNIKVNKISDLKEISSIKINNKGVDNHEK
jgi:hypothetical protein